MADSNCRILRGHQGVQRRQHSWGPATKVLHGLSFPRSRRPGGWRWSAFGEAAQHAAHFHAGHRPENGTRLFVSTGRKPLREGFLAAQVLEDGWPAGEREKSETLIDHINELPEIPSIAALLPGLTASPIRWTLRQHLSLSLYRLEININVNKWNNLSFMKSFLLVATIAVVFKRPISVSPTHTIPSKALLLDTVVGSTKYRATCQVNICILKHPRKKIIEHIPWCRTITSSMGREIVL